MMSFYGIGSGSGGIGGAPALRSGRRIRGALFRVLREVGS